MTKFLIVGDLHGQKPKIHFKNFDAIIAPGDFCSDEARSYMFAALKERLANPKSKINWYDLAGRKEAKRIVKESLADGRKILEFLNSHKVPVLITPGNWDWTADKKADWPLLRQDHYASLIRGLENIVDTHHKRIPFDQYDIIGHGITTGPEYPQHKEDLARHNRTKLTAIKKAYDKEYTKLARLFDKSQKPVIFISHNVPFNTSLDQIRNPASPRDGQHFGSLLARELTDRYQPIVCIGGHMHEYHGKAKLGRTTVINAGFGAKVNTLLEIEGSKIKSLKFYPEPNEANL